MSSAITLTLAHLGKHSGPEDIAGAFAAYITCNVASNLFGRLMSAAVADHFGLAAKFYAFAALNLIGAVLVLATNSPFDEWGAHFRNGPLVAGFGIGSCILFAFIGTFTYGRNFQAPRDRL